MKPVPISHARAAGALSGAARVAIIYVDDGGMFGITTWGRSRAECAALKAWAESQEAVLAAADVRDA